MIEKIKAEIQKVLDKERDFTTESAKAQALALFWVLELFDKYAEQEKDEPKQEPLTTVKCNERDCNNCTHYVCVSDGQYGCESWECEYDPVLPFKEHYEELAEHYDRRKS